MSTDREIGPLEGGLPPARTRAAHVELRRSVRSTRVASGTLACGHCDAPVALGTGPISVTASLTCPFCGHQAPTREFLSLALPTRPARVVVRVKAIAGG